MKYLIWSSEPELEPELIEPEPEPEFRIRT